MARTRRNAPIETDEEQAPYVLTEQPRNVRRTPPTIVELAASLTKAREDAAQASVELSVAQSRDEQAKANVVAALEELQSALNRS